MTEAEWLGCTNPYLMLEVLGSKIGERRSRLFAAACIRESWKALKDVRSQNAVELAEAYADGECTRAELKRARTAARVARVEMLNQYQGVFDRVQQREYTLRIAAYALTLERDFLQALNEAVDVGNRRSTKKRMAVQASLLRDIVGLFPFRRPRLRKEFVTPAVVAIAKSAYDARIFDCSPILGDALEDAGCTNADILDHCRQPGEHVRGCWVVDLVLGKS